MIYDNDDLNDIAGDEPKHPLDDVLSQMVVLQERITTLEEQMEEYRQEVREHVERYGSVDSAYAVCTLTKDTVSVSYKRQGVEEAHSMINALALTDSKFKVISDILHNAKQTSTRAGQLRIKYK